ncbi:MAG TPA: peptide-methionine (S)-S-oxide reductase MsrA [Abditibacterium sp.]|jgi:peptide-methionine (S)-S-oxide reductase
MKHQQNAFLRLWPLGVAAGLGLGLVFGNLQPSISSTAGTYAKKPLPVAKPAQGQEVATFAGGCFWSMEAMFQQLKGVSKVQPGYSGGSVANPGYEQVGTSKTGHAESINIIFDPKLISYSDLLEVLLTMRDPTTKNQQGPDVGPQYRSAIFTRSAAQKSAAQAMIKKIEAKGIWKKPIVTEVVPFKAFYRAEDYHLDYFKSNPNLGYCSAVIAPKIADLKVKFKHLVKS